MKCHCVVATISLSLFFASCSKSSPAPAASEPHATIVIRDGTTVQGTVVETSPTEVKIAGDDQITRTIPVSQVRAIEYGDVPASPAKVATEPPVPPKPSTPPAAPRTVAPARPLPPPAAQTQPENEVTESHTHPAESAITTQTYELPVGTQVSVRTEETIDSAKAVEGQTFAGEVTGDVQDASGAVVIPRGANAQIIIRSASKGGRIRGTSDLSLDLQSVAIDGREYELSTTDVVKQGKPGFGINKRTGEYSGGGAALGAIIGAIAGGGKGAAIGAGVGAGGGALTQVLTKGGAIRIPVETILTFELDKPLHVVAAE